MTGFIARKIRTSFEQRLNSSPDKVFPLLCPVREHEWIEPWRSVVLHSETGVAEKNCVFKTPSLGDLSRAGAPGQPMTDLWVVSRYEPDTCIEFVRMNPQRVSCLSITLVDNGDGTTRSRVEQLLVGLTEEGNDTLEDIAESFPLQWSMGEAMLNHYLATGKMLPFKDAMASASSGN